jgi:UDP-2-acetamido-3-amino-2,3-dideoxy-glucuronate N-acetyltransferase
MTSKFAQNASVSSEAKISENVSIWDFAQVRENAVVGENSIIGSYAYIDANVRIGKNCKIQNRALIYDPSIIHDGVFIGPGVILTNDKNPRSILDSGAIKIAKDWEKVGVEVLQGASIGSGAICVAPIKIGKWALVGAGAVVTKDVKDYALVVGNPARQVGWVGEAGKQLEDLGGQRFKCPISGAEYELNDGSLVQN